MASEHKMIGFTPYTDAMARQGMIEFRYYTHGKADHDHALGCPGCDPTARANPLMASWFEVEDAMLLAGDPPRCPKQTEAWKAARRRARDAA